MGHILVLSVWINYIPLRTIAILISLSEGTKPTRDSTGTNTPTQARPYVPKFLYTYKTQYTVEQEHKIKQSKATKALIPLNLIGWVSEK